MFFFAKVQRSSPKEVTTLTNYILIEFQPQSKPSAMFEITAKWIRSGEIVSVRESLKNRSLNPEEKDEVSDRCRSKMHTMYPIEYHYAASKNYCVVFTRVRLLFLPNAVKTL